MPADTIDITDTVEKMRLTFVEWGVGFVYGQEIAIPGMEWLALPVVSDIDKAIIRMVIEHLSKSVVMGGFFGNTALRKPAEAMDYVAAVNAVDQLSATATDDEYEKLTRAKMDAFRIAVSVT